MKLKRFVIAGLFAITGTAAFAADVGVSVTVGQPGFYGQINIGNAPPPVLVYPQPVVIRPVQGYATPVQPIYLHVPPGHAKDWAKHCSKYNACARPVYFVKDDWYNNTYVPYYQEQKNPGKGNGKGHGKGRD